MKRMVLMAIAVTLALGMVSCGADEIAGVDAEFELEQREQIDAVVADLEALTADPGRGRIAGESIGDYLSARREARRFNRALERATEDADPEGLPSVIAEDSALDPARREVPSLFGPTGKAIVPEDLRRFRRAVADDPAGALRPVVADPVDLLTTRARLYGLDATYPDQDGLTRREVITDAASVVEPYWTGLAVELGRALENPE